MALLPFPLPFAPPFPPGSSGNYKSLLYKKYIFELFKLPFILVLIFLFTIIKIKFIKKKDPVVGRFGLDVGTRALAFQAAFLRKPRWPRNSRNSVFHGAREPSAGGTDGGGAQFPRLSRA